MRTTTISVLCEKCKRQCSYSVEDIESNKFLVHEKCGWETSDVWCAKCGVGGQFVSTISSHPLEWRCPNCNTEYKLAEDFYKQPTPMHLKSKAKRGATHKEKWTEPRNIIGIGFVAMVILTALVQLVYLSSHANGAEGFYLEMIRELSLFLLFISGFFFFVCLGILGYRKNALSLKMLIASMLFGCFFLFCGYNSMLAFFNYAADFPLLKQSAYSTVSGQVDRIYHSHGGRGSWGNGTLYLKGGQYFNLGRYHPSGVSPGDRVLIKYLPASRHVIEIIK